MTTAADRAVDPAAAIGAVPAPTPGPRAARAREAVIAALERSDGAFAAWEAGSAAFGRADESSDLDLGVLCAPGAGERVLDQLEEGLRDVAPELDVWHVGVSLFGVQRFWQPPGDADAAPICMVDASVMEHDAESDLWRELLLPERHGRALSIFDPQGVLADAIAAATFDARSHRERIRAELTRIRERRALFGSFAMKELGRGRAIDANAIYQRMLVDPLVELLGMQYRPLRFDFARRYLHEELPASVAECLLGLVQPPSIDALPAACEAARNWIDRLLEELDPDELPIEQHAAQMRAAFGAG